MSSLLRSPFLDVTQRSPKVACVAGVERGSDIQKTAVRSRETTVCHAHEYFYGEKAPIYYQDSREVLFLILTENSFQFCGNNYLQTRGWNSHGNKDGRCFCWTFSAGVSGPDFK